ncbi:hypothetical protein ACIRFH_03760 [Streptomyces sp. NPDC093586]
MSGSEMRTRAGASAAADAAVLLALSLNGTAIDEYVYCLIGLGSHTRV